MLKLFKIKPAEKKVSLTRLVLSVAVLLAIGLAVFLLPPKHQALDELEVVTGVFDNSRVARGRTGWYGRTRVYLRNDEGYTVIGRYDFERAINAGDEVRLFVQGNQIWAMQTRTRVLVDYDATTRMYRNQRWFFRVASLLFFYFATIGAVRIYQRDYL